MFLEFTSDVAHYPNCEEKDIPELTYLALGLAGESGEFADQMKKVLRDDGDIGFLTELSRERRNKMLLELGDVFWYWIRCVHALDSSPAELIQMNQLKLAERMKEIADESRTGKVG